MRNFSLASITCLVLLFTGFSLHSQNTISYFDAGLVQSILNQEGCSGIRIYPAIDPSNNMQVAMIVGIDKYGNEIYNSSGKYHIYNGGNDRVSTKSIDKQSATSACSSYFSKYSFFVSDFSSSIVHASLANGSSGIAVQFWSGRSGNFAISSFSNNGQPKSTGEYKTGAPCPSACDDSSKYLVFPR